MYELNFRITNLTCGACIKMTTMIMRRLSAGVTEATVDLETGDAHLVSEEKISPEQVVAALGAKGYQTAFST